VPIGTCVFGVAISYTLQVIGFEVKETTHSYTTNCVCNDGNELKAVDTVEGTSQSTFYNPDFYSNFSNLKLST
jgi:hypothetical protein